jgi:hypothetical protein
VIAANENGERLQTSPGRTSPERIAIELYTYPKAEVRERWLQLIRDLVGVNPPLVRAIVQKLDVMEKEQEAPGARETREALSQFIQPTGPGTRERRKD